MPADMSGDQPEGVHVGPTRDELIRVASILWGAPNPVMSNGKEEIRFGTYGSKSLDLQKMVWSDHETGEGGGWTQLYMRAREPFPEDDEPRGPWRPIATYEYRDADGTLLFEVVRLPPKKFRQRQPDGSGGWINNIEGVKRVLYRLPELLATPEDEIVWIPEGEKDVDTLRRHGLAATTNPMGAARDAKGKWFGQYTEALRGKIVVLLPDNDDVGRSHMAAVSRTIDGVVRSVRTLMLPGLAEGGDVSDWLGRGNSVEDLLRLQREPPAPARQVRAKSPPFVPLNQIPPRPWVYGNFLLRGSCAVLGARDGAGKGQIAVVMALSLITGRALLDEPVRRPGPVAIISYEDDRDEWMRRIGAACLHYGVDFETVLRSLYFLDLPDRVVVLAQLIEGKTLFPDGDEVVATLQEIGAVALIIDPFNHAHQMPDGNSNVLIAQVAGEADRIVGAADCAGLVLHHLRKGASGEVDDLMGATSLRATFRSCRILDGMSAEVAETFGIEDRWRYLRLASGKQNYSPPAEKSYWFRLASVGLPNGNAEYPEGDNVGVATHWTPPSPFADLPWDAVIAVLDAIAAGMADGYRYSPIRQAKKRWAGGLLVEHGKSVEQAAQIVAAWLSSGLLATEDYETPNRQTAKGLRVDATKLAGMKQQQAAPIDL